jgi:hypothetical protein
MGEQAWEEASRNGRTMSLEEIVDFARERAASA